MFSPVYFYNPAREILDVKKIIIGTGTYVRNSTHTGKFKEKPQGWRLYLKENTLKYILDPDTKNSNNLDLDPDSGFRTKR
jgi:hypothetical protein